MKHIITPKTHGYIDYVSVALFLIAPTALGLSGVASLLSYLLAAVHLAMTLLTDFPLGTARVVPFSLHGWVERVVGPVLIVLAFVPQVNAYTYAQEFYLAMGVVILLVSLLSAYRGDEVSASAPTLDQNPPAMTPGSGNPPQGGQGGQ